MSARTNMMFLSTNHKTFVKPVLGEVTSMCGFHPCEFIFTHRAIGVLILFMHLVDGNCTHIYKVSLHTRTASSESSSLMQYPHLKLCSLATWLARSTLLSKTAPHLSQKWLCSVSMCAPRASLLSNTCRHLLHLKVCSSTLCFSLFTLVVNVLAHFSHSAQHLCPSS